MGSSSGETVRAASDGLAVLRGVEALQNLAHGEQALVGGDHAARAHVAVARLGIEIDRALLRLVDRHVLEWDIDHLLLERRALRFRHHALLERDGPELM